MRWMYCSLAAAMLLGCGPTVSDSGQGGSDDGSDADGSTAATSGPATSGATSADAGTGVGSTTVTETVTTTPQESITDPYMPTVSGSTGSTGPGVEVSSSSGETSSTTAAECDDSATYRAVPIIGALDRVRIFRRDDAAMRCDWLTLVWPAEVSQYDVPVVDSWGLEQASWNTEPASCDTEDPFIEGGTPVPDISGTVGIEFDGDGWPCTLDIDLTLQLIENPDPPSYVEMCQQQVVVEGCQP